MNTSHNDRITIVFLFFISFYIVLIGSLYTIQIRKADFYTHLAEQQYHVTITQLSPRAEIYDRTGTQPLALNKESLSAFIIPAQLQEPQQVTTFLKTHFPQAYKRFRKNTKAQFMYIKRRLNPQDIHQIEQSNLKDIKLLAEPSRYYPISSVGTIIGITDIDNKGILGIEQQYDTQLSGQPSIHVLEKDARSGHFYFKQETRIQGSLGKPLQTTLDGTLQFLVYEELKDTVQALNAKEAAALVIDPLTGEIIVMTSYPDFDPNDTYDLSIETTKNRIAVDAYELGSVIKVFLALAALDEQVVALDEIIDCENKTSYSIHGMPFTTLYPEGKITFSEVIERSNNIGVAKVAQKLGTKIYDHYMKLGFGGKIGLFAGEPKGFVTPPAQWSKASLISLSFGYEIRITLLQLAQAFCILAADGKHIPLHIIKNTNHEPTIQVYKSETVQQIKNILLNTVTKGNATKAHIPGYTILGKTGTARLLTNGKYDHTRHVFTFASIIDMPEYKRVIITFIKETNKPNCYAANTVVPLFARIARKVLIHDRIIA